eukprot:TRINITY_DN4889_c0_g1_i1.p1 TRINITY_DN4889_c0_g1~~TRINITY_DN4889_c0_g1_i1.p1  ORF type:complete len:379 (+),score=99.74 TRINITY_DN4889_c0_g1_i1:46-1182(+)
MLTKRDPKKEGWESADFPIVCESCLGDNPYLRMSKEPFGKECKVCGRPFTVFRWKPGTGARFKKTEVCQTCSKMKNVCQVCILDLEYGLPVQVRDSALGEVDEIPLSEANREFMADMNEKKVEDGLTGYGKVPPNEMLSRIARNKPYYKRNENHICSFFVRGTCTRGLECPYRHEMPIDNELSHQNIKDRFFGVNDPVANKILNRSETMTKLNPPADTNITTLFVAGLNPTIAEEDIRDYFYPYGELRSVKVIAKSLCAFVTYATRSSAEMATEALGGRNGLVVKGTPLRLQWAKPQSENPKKTTGDLPAGMAPPPGIKPNSSARPYYPSMDPSMMGSRPADAPARPIQQSHQHPGAMPYPPPGYAPQAYHYGGYPPQ